MSGAGKDKHEENRIFFRRDAAGTAHRDSLCVGRTLSDIGDAGGDGVKKKEYLQRLAEDSLTDEQIIWGFARFYLCFGLSSRELCRDVCMASSATAAKETGERLMGVFRRLAGRE